MRLITLGQYIQVIWTLKPADYELSCTRIRYLEGNATFIVGGDGCGSFQYAL